MRLEHMLQEVYGVGIADAARPFSITAHPDCRALAGRVYGIEVARQCRSCALATQHNITRSMLLTAELPSASRVMAVLGVLASAQRWSRMTVLSGWTICLQPNQNLPQVFATRILVLGSHR